MRLRAPVPADLEAVHAVLLARDIADLGAPDYKLDDLRDEWRSPEFDLGADARLAQENSGTVVGWAETRRQGGFAVVAPAAEGRGIGTALLRWLEAREREQGRPVHRQLVAATNLTGQRLLSDAGYELAWSSQLLRRGLDQPPAGPTTATAVAPPGVELRRLHPDGDAAQVHAVDAAAFTGQPGYEPASLDVFVDEELHSHDLDLGLSLVAERDGRIAGFLLARRREPEHVGFIEVLAVDPAEQGRGIGSALLATAIAAFAAAGLSAAELSVSSRNPRALGLYERNGLTERHRFEIYEKAATAGSSMT
jgi:mycothiol synthase